MYCVPFGLPDGAVTGQCVSRKANVDVISFAGDFSTFSEYQRSLLEWEENTILLERDFILPVPMSISVANLPKPLIEKEVVQKLGRSAHAKSAYLEMTKTGLSPENALAIQEISIFGTDFDSNAFLPKPLSGNRLQAVSSFITKETSKLKNLVSSQPLPSFYDSFDDYKSSLLDWCSKGIDEETYSFSYMNAVLGWHNEDENKEKTVQQKKETTDVASSSYLEYEDATGIACRTLFDAYKESIQKCKVSIPQPSIILMMKEFENEQNLSEYVKNIIQFGDHMNFNNQRQNLYLFVMLKKIRKLQVLLQKPKRIKPDRASRDIPSGSYQKPQFLFPKQPHMRHSASQTLRSPDEDFSFLTNETFEEFQALLSRCAKEKIALLGRQMIKIMLLCTVQVNLLWAKVYYFFHVFIKEKYESFGIMENLTSILYSVCCMISCFSLYSLNVSSITPPLISDDDPAFQMLETSTKNVRYLQTISQHFNNLGSEYKEVASYFENFKKDFTQVFESCLEFTSEKISDYLQVAKATPEMALFLVDLMKLDSRSLAKLISSLPNSIFYFYQDDDILKTFRYVLLVDPLVSRYIFKALLLISRKNIAKLVLHSDMMRSFLSEVMTLTHPMPKDFRPHYITDVLSPIAQTFNICDYCPLSVENLVLSTASLFIESYDLPAFKKTFLPFLEQNILFFLAIIRQKDCLLSVSLEVMTDLLPLAFKHESINPNEVLMVIEPITLHMCCADAKVSRPAWRCLTRILIAIPTVIYYIEMEPQMAINLVIAFSGITEDNLEDYLRLFDLYGSTVGTNEAKKLRDPAWKSFARLISKTPFSYPNFREWIKEVDNYLNSRRFTSLRNSVNAIFHKYPNFASACKP